MLALISSVPVATVCRFLLTCSAPAATTLACAEVSSAFALICWLVAVSSSEALASDWAFCVIDCMLARSPSSWR